MLLLTSRRFTASLSSDDLIVNAPAVRDYLVGGELPDPVVVGSATGETHVDSKTDGEGDAKAMHWRGVGLEVLWWDGYDHASVLETQQDRAKLVKVVVEYCSGE